MSSTSVAYDTVWLWWGDMCRMRWTRMRLTEWRRELMSSISVTYDRNKIKWKYYSLIMQHTNWILNRWSCWWCKTQWQNTPSPRQLSKYCWRKSNKRCWTESGAKTTSGNAFTVTKTNHYISTNGHYIIITQSAQSITQWSHQNKYSIIHWLICQNFKKTCGISTIITELEVYL